MKKIFYLCILFMSACASSNIVPHPRDTKEFHEEISSFREGVSNKANVMMKIGKPDMREIYEDEDVWIYWRQELTEEKGLFGSNYTGTKNADIYYRISFDEDGIMAGIEHQRVDRGDYGKNLPYMTYREVRH